MLNQKFKSFASLTNEAFLYNKQNLDQQRNEIDKALNEEGFHYDIPTLLCQPYDFVQISNKHFIRVYHHLLEFKMSQSSLMLGIITSTPLKPCDTIKYTYFSPDGKQVIHETVTVLTTEKQSIMKKEDFKNLLKFNQFLQAEWYKIAVKNLEKHEKNLEEYLDDGQFNFDKLKRTYLFTINLNGEIDWNRMENFIAERLGLISPRSMNQDYLDISNKLFLVLQLTKPAIMYTMSLTTFGKEKFLNILSSYKNFQVRNGLLKKQFNIMDINESIGKLFYELPFKVRIEAIYHLRNSYERQKGTKEEFKQNQPIAMALYTRHLKSVQMFRTEQFKFIIEQEQQKTFESSVRTILSLKKPQISLIPISSLGVFEFDIEEMDKLMQFPMIMLDLERQVIAQEITLLLGIDQIPPDQLLQATQTPGYSPSQNYEILETVGDSILKYISTYIVFQHFGHYKLEDYLTQKRSEFIVNKLLGKILYESNLSRFVKVQFYNYSDWLSPVLINIFSSTVDQSLKVFSQPKIKLTTKVLADIYEALIGAVFMCRYTFKECYMFLKNTKHPLTNQSKPINIEKYLNVFFNKLMIIKVNIQLSFNSQEPMFQNLETTYRDLCFNFIQISPDILQQISESIQQFIEVKKGDDFLYTYYSLHNLSFLQFLQDTILQYRFQKVQLLIEALTMKPFNNSKMDLSQKSQIFKFLSPDIFQERQFVGFQTYEKLEFLGDAIIEAFVVSNAYLAFQEIGLQVNPDLMHKVKMTLLGNSFMARQCVANGLHHFMINRQGSMKDITDFEDQVNFDIPFKDYVGNIIPVPKSLSDIWESICGAILIDGGWKAVIETYGNFYRPFIQFVCNFIFEIQEHIVLRVQHYCTRNFQCYEFVLIDSHTCQIIGDGQVQAVGQGENEKVAKEKACRVMCKKFNI